MNSIILPYNTCYTERNKISINRLVISFPAIIFCLFIVSYVYVVSISVFPVFLFQVVYSAVVAAVLFLLYLKLAKYSKIRGINYRLGYTIFCSFVFTYFSLFFTYKFSLQFGDKNLFSTLYVLYNPYEIISTLIEKHSQAYIITKQHGNYSTNLIIISFYLRIVLFLIVPSIMVYLNKSLNPVYSEKLDKWYKKIVLKNEPDGIYDATNFVDTLSKHGIDVILNLPKTNKQTRAVISLYYLPNETIQYITIDNVLASKRSERKTVIDKMAITTVDAKQLMERLKIRRNSLFDYYES